LPEAIFLFACKKKMISNQNKLPKTIQHTIPAESFDADGYFEGFWFEQARTKNRFQEGCVQSTAFYKDNGRRITIKNSCTQKDGSLREGPPMSATGRPMHKDKASYNVSVYFIPSGVYNVLYANNVRDPSAGVAIVAGARFDKVWVLTRSESPSVAQVESIKKIAESIAAPVPIAWH
jgi:lipocalin